MYVCVCVWWKLQGSRMKSTNEGRDQQAREGASECWVRGGEPMSWVVVWMVRHSLPSVYLSHHQRDTLNPPGHQH
jgi:hypothetical protein